MRIEIGMATFLAQPKSRAQKDFPVNQRTDAIEELQVPQDMQIVVVFEFSEPFNGVFAGKRGRGKTGANLFGIVTRI